MDGEKNAPAEVKADGGGGTAVVAGRKIRCQFDFVGIQVCPFNGCFQKLENPPKWMVFFRESPIRIDDLGGTPIFGNTLLRKGFTLQSYCRDGMCFAHQSYLIGSGFLGI